MNTEITSKENSIKELQYEIKEIEDIKAQADKRIFNYKIWAVEGICHNYFINKLNNFSYSDSLYCCSMDKNDTYRKPNTGMLEQLYYQYKVESKDECIMIGDASGKSGDFSDSDRRCASRFFIDYIDVRDFLKL